MKDDDNLKRIYLTRHGETVFNVENRFQGQKDSPLTEKGIGQAKKLGKSLEAIEFDLVYSSPLGRACESCKYILGEKKNEIIKDDRLMEIKLDEWSGKPKEVLQRDYSEQLTYFWEKPKNFDLVGCETFQQLCDRTHEFISDILKQEFQNLLIVSHGVVIKSILMLWDGRDFDNFWTGEFIRSTSLSVIEFDEKLNGKIMLNADMKHL